MRTVYLDSELFHDTAEIHKFLREELDFPEYYGGNLAALFDCMTDICDPTVIRCRKGACCDVEMENYFSKIIMVLKDAAEENDVLAVEELS